MNKVSEIRIKGAPNFRDMGGCPAGDGRIVKRGVLFRSGHLSSLTAADMETLRRLNIGLIVDLRSRSESELHPTRWPEEIETKRLSMHIDTDLRAGDKNLLAIVREDPTVTGARRVVEHTYRSLPAACGPTLKVLIDRLAQGQMPALVHCTQGRDRTGFVCAMVLHALGATRDVIAADFLKTNETTDIEEAVKLAHATLLNQFGVEVEREALYLMTRVSREFLDAGFDVIDKTWGSSDGYLQAFGIDEPLKEKLRRQLLEPI